MEEWRHTLKHPSIAYSPAQLTLRCGEHNTRLGLTAPAVGLQVCGIQCLLGVVLAEEDGLEAHIEKLVAIGGLNQPRS